MIVFNRNGFTLIEVLLAMALFGMVMTPLVIMQGTLVQQSARRAVQLSRMIGASSLLAQAHINVRYDKESPKEQKNTYPVFTATYKTKKSASLKQFKGVVLDEVVVEWQENKRKRIERFISMHFKPEERS